MELPDYKEVRKRIDSIKDIDSTKEGFHMQMVLKALYLFGATVNKMVAEVFPGEKRPVYGPRGKDAKQEDIYVAKLEQYVPAYLFTINRNRFRANEPHKRTIALPVKSELWAEELYKHFEKAGNEYVFRNITRLDPSKYVTEKGLFAGLKHTINAYKIGGRLVPQHIEPLGPDGLLEYRIAELEKEYGFDPYDLGAYGVGKVTLSKTPARRLSEKEARNHYFEKLCKPNEENRTQGTPLTLEKLSEDTFLPQELLSEWEILLEEKKQIILYGPPGTGKTFVAKKFSNYFTHNNGETEIVVFHPSYGYEDFIEGIRPIIVEETHQINYEPFDGILKRLKGSAIREPDKRFVLLIDEINRGNIARIFGEIIYCLEYRGEQGKVKLPYSRNYFFIPSNLYIIGTMNSADRSIALVDYALRRRFSFIDFLPQKEILEKWFEKNPPSVNKEAVIKLLETINQHVKEDYKLGKHFLIGHSYFMRPQLDRKKVEEIWKYNIVPLLEEYYFEDEEAIEGFQKLFDDLFVRNQGNSS